MLSSSRTHTEDTLYHPDVIHDKQRHWKRILIVDDNVDITVTFKTAIEDNNNTTLTKKIEVHTSNNPVIALSEFKPNFYDLLLVDIIPTNINSLTHVPEKVLEYI